MLGWFKRLLGRTTEPGPDEAEEEAWAEQRGLILGGWLGEMHDMVMHSMIPYFLGGALDVYYFPDHIEGVGLVTQELSHAGPSGSNNEAYDAYELVMFTRHALDIENAEDESTPFGRAHTSMNRLLNLIAKYSEEATLNANETCEFPEEMEDVGGKCLVFDGYRQQAVGGKTFGLLLIIEVFRSEMEYARRHGGGELIARLKAAGHYPYSDLDRRPVV